MTTEIQVNDLERFRNYLSILAEMNMDSRLRSKLDVADIVQQAMLRAIKAFPDLKNRSEGAVVAWLQKILSSELADVGRSYRRQSRDIVREQQICASLKDSSEMLTGFFAADITSPSMAAARNEDLVKLANALSSLAADTREIVVLKHMKNLSVAEIATQTGRSRAAVAGCLSRGMSKLREKLA